MRVIYSIYTDLQKKVNDNSSTQYHKKIFYYKQFYPNAFIARVKTGVYSFIHIFFIKKIHPSITDRNVK